MVFEGYNDLGKEKELKDYCKIQYPRREVISNHSKYNNKYKHLFDSIKTYDDIKKMTIETIKNTDKESDIFISICRVFTDKKFCEDFCNAIVGKNIFFSFKNINTANHVLKFLKHEPFIFLFRTDDLFSTIERFKGKYHNLIEPEREKAIRYVVPTDIDLRFKALQDKLILHFFNYVSRPLGKMSTKTETLIFNAKPNCYIFSFPANSYYSKDYCKKNDFLKSQQVYIDIFIDYYELDPFCSFMCYGIEAKLFTLKQKEEMLNKYESTIDNELLKLKQ